MSLDYFEIKLKVTITLEIDVILVFWPGSVLGPLKREKESWQLDNLHWHPSVTRIELPLFSFPPRPVINNSSLRSGVSFVAPVQRGQTES